MEQISPPQTRELARRRNLDGMEVVLKWVVGSIVTYVDVEDAKYNTVTRIFTPDAVSPNDVFNHPFKYAGAENGIAA